MTWLPATLAALGAVIGFLVGATFGTSLWLASFGRDSSDIPPIVIGGLAGAFALAWTGIRLASRFAGQPQAH